MKDLIVSPLRYWHKHINPERVEDDETPAMRFGSALHCAVLEPEKFDAVYAKAIDGSEYEGLLVTVSDLRGWLEDHGLEPKGREKAKLIEQVQRVDPKAPILAVLEERALDENKGKIVLTVDEWRRVNACKSALLANPSLQALLAEGTAEQSMFAVDPDTGVPLKCRVDWLCDYCILDLKTFSQMRGKTIDDTVADALYYEGYFRQAWLYSYIRSLVDPKFPIRRAVCVYAFVESEEPCEVRLKELRPASDGQANLYWQKGGAECRMLMQTYAEYWSRYREKPWRDEQEIVPLIDDDIRQLAY